MAHSARKRKCLHCKGFFYPDHRNVGRQRYCSKPECCHVSKTERQRRWRQKPDNLDPFKGKENVQRVQLIALGFDSGDLATQVAIIGTTLGGFAPPLVTAPCDFGQLTHGLGPLAGLQELPDDFTAWITPIED